MSENKKGIPKLRYPEFTDEWEQRKFNDFVIRLSKTSNSNQLPKVEFEDIIAGEGRLNKDVQNKFDNRKGTLFYPENILYGKLRPYLKNWLFPDFEGIALGDFWVFESSEANPSFIYSLIQSDSYQKVANDTAGTKMPRSDWKKVSNTLFAIPKNIEEQQKIGNFFKELDNLITLHQRKLDHLKNEKNGLLQKMFPKNGESFPVLRFPEFTDAWEQRKVKTYGNDYYGGGTPKTTEESYWDGTLPWIQSSDLSEHVLTVNTPKKSITEIGVANSAAKKIPANSISIVTRVGVGKLAFMPYEFATSQDFISISDLNVNSLFGIYSLYRLLQKQKNAVQGTSIKGITRDSLFSMSLSVPNFIDEQQKIGNFFKEFDKLITLHQRKLDNLKLQKKALLQQMFV
ncbi:type I restriction enzyme S subunit [Enterococcus sp. PF1-24]|uniref:restriction endonuclease subunit S n=1 Tax=Enterococcus sp. PF1-24 TaxID=1742399 RepID=UPI002476CFE4|nr:restriction endonuclease subunit S [Enterococcus sp. PF1-24]MDH6401158.1 type I restriction enzyme S subunit [Enterococcus sp. PF1-24]